MLHRHLSLEPELETVATAVIDACLEVHRALGPGLLEAAYARACAIEFDLRGLEYRREVPVPVLYKGRLVSEQRLDFLFIERVILEVKAVENLVPVHHAQVLSYLKATGLRLALLLNFNVPVLKQGIRRIVL